MNRQKLALAILLVIFAGAVAYSFLRQPPAKTVARLKYTTGMTAAASRTVTRVIDDKKLHIDLLDRQISRFSGFRRNIFRPIFSAEISLSRYPLNIARPGLPVPPPLPAPPPPLPPPPEATPAQRAMTEVGRYTFLGFLQKENRKIIFLSKDNEIILVRKGDKIAGKYEVANISDEALTFNLLATGEQIVVPLAENRPLKRR